VKALSTPFGSMFSSMAVEDSEEALTPDRIKVDNKRMCIFHGTSTSLVLRHTERKGGMVGRYTIENLDMKSG
jgi:hypothetical protein